MNRKSLSGMKANSSIRSRAAERLGYASLHLEPLEERRVLDAAYINEIYWDPPGGTDVLNEYIELRGTPNMSLDNYYYISIENEDNDTHTGHTGEIDTVFDLSGHALGANGYLILWHSGQPYDEPQVDGDSFVEGTPTITVSDVLENGGGTAMLIHNVSGSAPVVTQDLDVDNDGLDVATGAAGWEIVDAIGVHCEQGEALNGRLYGMVNFGPEASTNIEPGATYDGLNYEIEYLGRWGNSTGQTAADWHASNLTNETIENGGSGYSGHGDFRQSGSPHGLGTPGQVVETNKGVAYGTNLTGTLGGPNFQNATIDGRKIFYNGSKFDGNNQSINSTSDAAAIATDKSAYLPGAGSPIGIANTTSFSRGINGLMVDVAHPNGTLSTSDFIFKMSNQGSGATGANNTPSTWASAPAPASIAVFTNTPTSGTDRVEIIWNSGDIANRYLEVTVKGADSRGGFDFNTGLAASDIFYFGNKIGETFLGALGANFNTSSADEGAIRSNVGVGATITNVFDVNKNGSGGDASDQASTRGANFGLLTRINIANPPAAPEAAPTADEGSASAVASALAKPSLIEVGSTSAWITSRLEGVSLGSLTAATVAPQMVGEDDPPGRLEPSGYDLADELGLDEELLDVLLGGPR